MDITTLTTRRTAGAEKYRDCTVKFWPSGLPNKVYGAITWGLGKGDYNERAFHSIEELERYLTLIGV